MTIRLILMIILIIVGIESLNQDQIFILKFSVCWILLCIAMGLTIKLILILFMGGKIKEVPSLPKKNL